MGNYSSKERNAGEAEQHDAIPSRVVQQRAAPMASEQMFASASSGSSSSSSDDQSGFDGDMNNVVPTVFKWEKGGRNVCITGTFNNWERGIPMHKSGNDFSYVHNLKRGKHYFKFIVDEEWRYDLDQATVPDQNGQTTNFIDVTDFAPYIGDDSFFEKSKERKIPDEEFRQLIPDLDEYTKEPPTLPPHLRHIILNKPSPSTDPLALPAPQHVSLNHLYCTAIKDGMMVLGATQRYKDKYFTVVFYSVMPN